LSTAVPRSQEGEEEKAERLVKEELARRKWVEEDLAGGPRPTARSHAGRCTYDGKRR
jgi:hypothetical protein